MPEKKRKKESEYSDKGKVWRKKKEGKKEEEKKGVDKKKNNEKRKKLKLRNTTDSGGLLLTDSDKNIYLSDVFKLKLIITYHI